MIPLFPVLVWLHIIAMTYWLGGEWGVFQTSYNIINPKLSLEERRRHLETAYRIDILARTGIMLLFPLGFQMGHLLGVNPFGDLVAPVWVIALAWMCLTWSAFIKRDTDIGIRLTRWDERLRYFLIPLLLYVSIKSLVTGAPFAAKWFDTKILIYACLLIIGLGLRFVMRHWTTIFREMAAKGITAELQSRIDREIALSRLMAYVYWIGIGSVAFIGVAAVFGVTSVMGLG